METLNARLRQWPGGERLFSVLVTVLMAIVSGSWSVLGWFMQSSDRGATKSTEVHENYACQRDTRILIRRLAHRHARHFVDAFPKVLRWATFPTDPPALVGELLLCSHE
jgi:hypothetical protein